MTIWIILFVLLTAAAGYFVNKATNAQAEQANKIIDAVTDIATGVEELSTAVSLSKSQVYLSETFANACREAFGHIVEQPFVYQPKAPQFFGIRQFIQNLGLSQQLNISRVYRNITEYPNCVFIICQSKVDQGKMLIQVNDFFTQEERVKDPKIFESWKEETGGTREGEIWLGEGPRIRVFVDAECDEQCSWDDISAIQKAAKEAEVETLPLRHSERNLYLHTMGHTFGKDTLTRTQMKPSATPWAVFTASYPGNISIAKVKTLQVGDAIDKVIKHAHKATVNLIVEGPKGSGKSSLFKFLATKLAYAHQAEGKELKLIEWRGTTAAHDPTELIRQHCGKEGPVLLLVEDAHLFTPTQFAGLLNLMDGIDSPEGLSVIVGYNAAEVQDSMKAQFEALLRPGRATMELHLKPFPKEARETLLTQIRTLQELVEIEGAAAALSDDASLADIWACFRHKGMTDFL